MSRSRLGTRAIVAGGAVMFALMGSPAPAAARPVGSGPLDGPLIEKLTGARGSFDPAEGVFKVSVPRTDLKVTVGGSPIVPAQGLVSWVAFQGTNLDARIMGDLVLAEDQVNPVMSAALDAGLEVTALHHHFLRDSPRVMFMHVGGTGDVGTLASAVGKVFARIAATNGGRGESRLASVDPARSSLDTARIEGVLRVTGASGGGVFKVVVGRTTTMGGTNAGSAMGVNSWAAFAGSDEQAVVDGDLAVLEPELQTVLKALRAAGIDVVAIHQHMTGEQPRVMFVHYWGTGPASALAHGVRDALDRMGAVTGTR